MVNGTTIPEFEMNFRRDILRQRLRKMAGEGIAAFMQSTREDLERGESAGPSEMQLKQNSLMFRRIFYQAAAILVVAVLLFANQK